MHSNSLRAKAGVLKNAYRLLVKNDPMRLAGATAFFTTFALPPILIILIQMFSLIFERKSISRQLFAQLSQVVGEDSVKLLFRTQRGFRGLAENVPFAIAGFIFLLFVATTLFKVIQSSINQIWMVRRKKSHRFKNAYQGRLKFTLIILFTGILFLTTLFGESLKLLSGKYIHELMPSTAILFNGAISALLSISIICVWFTVIFHFLPDAKPSWRISLTGGLLTSILFHIGKYILAWMLPGNNIGAVYGTSASIVLLLLFVFYSSLIFYYGAAFTREWGAHMELPLKPLAEAEIYEYTEVGLNESGDIDLDK